MTSLSTWPERLVLLVLLGVTTLAARPADACSTNYDPTAMASGAPDVFAAYDGNAAVGEYKVTAAPGFSIEGHGKSGAVVMTQVRALKGTPPKQHTLQQQATPCGGYSKNQIVVVVFDAKGPVLFADKTTAKPLGRWRDAKTPAARSKLLGELVKSKDPYVAGAATKQLAAQPAATPAAWEGADPTWKKPGTSKAAIARFHAVWPAMVTASGKELNRFADAIANKRCEVSASKESCKAELGIMKPSNVAPVLGSVDALVDGSCWRATCSVGFFDVWVEIDADDGKVLVVWLPPEG